MTFETFVQSDERTWHDQKQIDKDKYKDKDNDKDNDNDNDKDKDTDKVPQTLNICYVFEILMTHSFQIWW